MKALLFHKYRNICIKTILWTRNTYCFTIFVHRKLRRKNHSDCDYHLVQRPRKWGLKVVNTQWLGQQFNSKFYDIQTKYPFEKNQHLQSPYFPKKSLLGQVDLFLLQIQIHFCLNQRKCSHWTSDRR